MLTKRRLFAMAVRVISDAQGRYASLIALQALDEK